MSALTTKVKNQLVFINTLFLSSYPKNLHTHSSFPDKFIKFSLIIFCILSMLPAFAMDFSYAKSPDAIENVRLQKNLKLQSILLNENVVNQVRADFESHNFDKFEVSALGDGGCELRPLRLVPLFARSYEIPDSYKHLSLEDKEFLTMCHIVSKASVIERDCFGLEFQEKLIPTNVKYGSSKIKGIQEIFSLLREKLAEESVNYLRLVADAELKSAVSTNCRHTSGGVSMAQEPTSASIAVLVEDMRRKGFSVYLMIKRLAFDSTSDRVMPFIYQGGGIIPLLDGNAENKEGHRPAVFIEAYSMKSPFSAEGYRGFLGALNAAETFEDYHAMLLEQRYRLLDDLIFPAAAFIDDVCKKTIHPNFLTHLDSAKVSGLSIVPYMTEEKTIFIRTRESAPLNVLHVHASSLNVEQDKLGAIPRMTRSSAVIQKQLKGKKDV